MMFWSYGTGGLMMLGMILGNLLWLVLLGVLIWACIRWSGRYIHPSASEPSALEILRRRYARGEIDATTFEQMKERLEATTHYPAGHL